MKKQFCSIYKMNKKMDPTWYKLEYTQSKLQLLGMLNGGQSFRWTQVIDENEEYWTGVFDKKLWILKQVDNCILYQVYTNKSEDLEKNELAYKSSLYNYFQLDVNLSEHYDQWCKDDKYFKIACSKFYGIRVLRQDLVENIFSFICSSNNNIQRITLMVENLAKCFGKEICNYRGKTYYSFPAVESLAAHNVYEILKEKGFGYRAQYIYKSAQYIVNEGNEIWLEKLKQLPYNQARSKLMTLTGVGPKVADCICLMSLGHLESVPVDTHVYKIARSLFLPKLPQQKALTDKIYKEIGDHFRTKYGPYAGWAQTVLFCADLRLFQEASNNKVTAP